MTDTASHSGVARPRLAKIDSALLAVVVLLIIVLGAGVVVSDRFATWRNFSNVFEQMAALGFVSLGQTLVVLAGGVDLSIGALVSAITVLLAALCQGRDDALVLAFIGVSLAAGVLVGLINGGIVMALRVHPLIVTIGSGAILNGLTLMYTRQPGGGAPDWLQEFAYGRILSLPTAGLSMLLLFALFGFLLAKHPFGRGIYAVGGNPDAARLSGVSIARTTLTAYAGSGLMAALAAVYFVSRTGVGDPLVGEPLTLASITPVVVGGIVLGGGRGNLLGALFGVALIAFLNNVLNYLNVSTFLQWVAQGVTILLAVSVRLNRRGAT
jgi:ribose/xylose/arabinose/galactoside ABC-type transport system permease subunit